MELDKEWECLVELTRSGGLFEMMEPYISKCLITHFQMYVFKLYTFIFLFIIEFVGY